MSVLLETNNLTAYYGQFQALFGIDIQLNQGETLAIIGANGAGKTTLLQSLMGAITNAKDAIMFDGKTIGDLPAFAVSKLGIAIVPEGRRLFPSLSVKENLLIGGYGKKSAQAAYWDLNKIYELFPVLEERQNQLATSLSGGQQQMLAIGRALICNPKLLLCDELSLGLAPIVINDIYATIPEIKQSGISLIIVEQDISQAMQQSDQMYCLMEGKISLSGKPDEVSKEQIHAAYFGINS